MTRVWLTRAALAIVVTGFGLATTDAFAQKSTRMKSGETSLLGINLYDPVRTVIRKFGNPDSVRPIVVTFEETSSGGGPTGGGVPGGVPDAGGGPPGGGPMKTGRGGPGGGVEGGSLPNPGMGGQPTGFGNTGTDGGVAVSRQAMYIYLRKGVKYTFIINDKGQVVQIGAIAERDPGTRTRKGITLGSKYQDVIRTYGWPENHEFQGNSIMLIKYLKNQHVAFQTFNQKVVGITVAAGAR